jgi:hypothetical protein
MGYLSSREVIAIFLKAEFTKPRPERGLTTKLFAKQVEG